MWSEGLVGFESASDSSLARKAESSSSPQSPGWEVVYTPFILKPESLSWLVPPKKNQIEFLFSSTCVLGTPDSSSMSMSMQDLR